MRIAVDVLVTPDCPHASAAEWLVRDVADGLVPDARIGRTEVSDAAEAERYGFPGSPTVRVNGEDLEGLEPGPAAFACRRYEDGEGVPPRWLVEAGLLRAARPRHVLFLCVANSARSQMAEGIARTLAPEAVRVSSAGSEPSRVNPFALEALREIGIDVSGHYSKSMDDLRAVAVSDLQVDAVITLCAEEVCPVWLGDAYRLHWPLPDPAAASGTGGASMDSFRGVRDELRRRLAALFRPRVEPPT